MGQHRERFVARRFQRVGAQIDRSAFGEGAAFLDGPLAKGRGEVRREPFRNIRGNMQRCAIDECSGKTGALVLRERRGSMSLAGIKRCYLRNG